MCLDAPLQEFSLLPLALLSEDIRKVVFACQCVGVILSKTSATNVHCNSVYLLDSCMFPWLWRTSARFSMLFSTSGLPSGNVTCATCQSSLRSTSTSACCQCPLRSTLATGRGTGTPQTEASRFPQRPLH